MTSWVLAQEAARHIVSAVVQHDETALNLGLQRMLAAVGARDDADTGRTYLVGADLPDLPRPVNGAQRLPPVATGRVDPDVLTLEQAAQLLQCKPSWLLRNHPKLPFTLRLGKKHLRFTRAGIEAYVKRAAR